MANVFFRQNKMDIADSLYAEVSKTSTHPVSVSLFFFFLLCTFQCFPVSDCL